MEKKKKQCRKCQRLLPLESFHRCSAVKDGRRARCKECLNKENRERIQRPEIRDRRRAYSRAWNNSLKGRSYHKAYKRTEKYKASDHKRRRAERNRHKLQARDAVHSAVRYGRLDKKPCAICGASETEAHHILGYDPTHWTDVVWLCHEHHLKADERLRQVAEENETISRPNSCC